nr:hypothetical protein [Acinetobacter ursingii]
MSTVQSQVFKLSTLPSNGSFYSNSAGTGTALTTTDVIAATSNGATIYFKPMRIGMAAPTSNTAQPTTMV